MAANTGSPKKHPLSKKTTCLKDIKTSYLRSRLLTRKRWGGGRGGRAARDCCARCVATRQSVPMSDADVGSAGGGCERCSRVVRLEHAGRNRKLCQTCRRALKAGKQWELPINDANQARVWCPEVRCAISPSVHASTAMRHHLGAPLPLPRSVRRPPSDRGTIKTRGITREGVPAQERARMTQKRKRRRRHHLGLHGDNETEKE
jgi:hypothetical protein